MTHGDHDMNQGVGSSNTKVRSQISDWVKDVVALEAHVEEALDRQLQLEPSDPEVKQAIKKFHDTVRDSKHSSEEYLKQMGAPASKGLVERGAELLGVAAGIIDKVRHDTASKSIRDDYTAFNHVAIAYTMLYTTAVAGDDQDTAAFAEKGLRTYAGLVQDVNHIIAKAVIADLKSNTEMPVERATVVDQVQRVIDTAWKSTAN